MAKSSGLGVTTFSWDTSGDVVKTIVNDFTTFSIDTPRALQDITGLDKSAMERLQLLADYTVTGTTVFNDAADQEFDVFSIMSGERDVSLVHSAETLNTKVFLSSTALTRAASGELTRNIAASLSDGTVPVWS